jgi:mercuric reductase
MDATARDGFARLTKIIPLATRQAALPPAWRAAHRAILVGYAVDGRPPRRADLAAMPGIDDADALLARLDGDDMVVLDATGEIAGAYPFTSEATPHTVTLGDATLHAMCAVDALSVAPMLGCTARVDSRCAVSDVPVCVAMDGLAVTECTPAELWVGIHWAPACGHTAHSLCRQMLFLAGGANAEAWQATAPEARRCYTLRQAIDLGAAFFVPLLA